RGGMALLSICSDIGVETSRRQKVSGEAVGQRTRPAARVSPSAISSEAPAVSPATPRSISVFSSWRGRGRARPWQRYLRDLIAGLADVPLAHAVAAGAFGEVHMDVVLMIAV